MYQRALFQTIKDRAIEPRRFIQVLAGPRQVGKTTLVTQVMQHLPFPAHYATADGFGKPGKYGSGSNGILHVSNKNKTR